MNCEIVNKFKELYEVSPEYQATSPGRVDLMGSHTDYNHGFVVTMPINLEVECAFSTTCTNVIEIYSLNLETSITLDCKTGMQTDGDDWGKYVSAIARVLIDEGKTLKGFKGVFCSAIPIGSGLSSSAALEAIVMLMMSEAGDFEISKLNNALWSQKAENKYVGVNCGILDQYSVVFGERHKVIKLDCRELNHAQVEWPEDLMVAICNTVKPRQLHGSEYDDRRANCEEAVEVFAKIDKRITHLRDVSLNFFNKHKDQLSELARKRAQFIIEENNRTHELDYILTTQQLDKLDDLLDRSFQGAKDLFGISCTEMEQMYTAMKSAPGVVAARQAGAGFGGCMVAFIEKDKLEEFSAGVMKTYKELSGIDCEVYGVRTAQGAHVRALNS